MGYTGSMRSFISLPSAAALFALAVGCGGGNALPTGPSPVSANVELRYEVATAATEAAPSEALDCEGQVRLYPSWWGYAQVTMAPTGADRWGLLFEEVPIGEQRVNVVAPEGCGGGNLTANGVVLSDAPNGFSFTLHPDGSVTR